jgi:hypothetical protein
MDPRYITLVSSASAETFDNSPCRFTNSLPKEIYCKKCEYQIAVQSLYLDLNFGNIPLTVLSVSDHIVVLNSSDLESEPVSVINIAQCRYTLFDFIKELNSQSTQSVVFNSYSRSGVGYLMMRVFRKFILMHSTVSAFLGFTGENIIFKNQTYISLDITKEARAIRGTSPFPEKPTVPKVIKIKLGEMKQSLSVKEFHRDLAIIVDENIKYEDHFFHVVKRKEYFDIIDENISSLSVLLTDENNCQLNLKDGQPSILKLKLRKKSMNSFILRISSLDCRDIYQNNSSAQFMVQLPQPFPQQKMWEVALSSIYYPSRMDLTPILRDEDFWIDVGAVNIMTKDILGLTRITFSHLTDVSAEAIINAMHLKISTLDLFTIREDDGVYNIHFRTNAIIVLSPLMAYCLGRPMLGKKKYRGIEGKVGESIVLGKFNLDRLYPSVMFLHCNFVSPSIIGNTFAQVLKIIPYKSDNEEELVQHDVEHLDFFLVSMNDQYLLTFEMKDARGRMIKFKNQDNALYLNLIFREIQ